MRIWVRQDLPVEPRNPRGVNLSCPLLNVCIARTDADRIASVAVVVYRVRVACTPLLHDELLACRLRAGDVFPQLRSGKVADAISVDGEDVECSTSKVGVEERVCKISPAAGGDQYILAASERRLERFGYCALPARESCRIALLNVSVSELHSSEIEIPGDAWLRSGPRMQRYTLDFEPRSCQS